MILWDIHTWNNPPPLSPHKFTRYYVFSVCVHPSFQFAVDKMTSVSKHINKMKEEYDADVHIRGIQDLIRGLEVCKIVLLAVLVWR